MTNTELKNPNCPRCRGEKFRSTPITVYNMPEKPIMLAIHCECCGAIISFFPNPIYNKKEQLFN